MQECNKSGIVVKYKVEGKHLYEQEREICKIFLN